MQEKAENQREYMTTPEVSKKSGLSRVYLAH